ncbi:MAG: sugar transporter subunit [Herbinix sp.]|nr:sugar transporter subunit [Herbinix sp.]
MIFKKSEQNETLQLLQKKNIIVNCVETEKEQVIKKVGTMLVESGYVIPSYIDAMFERENTFATYMGNGIALPHGVESAKEGILSSGIAVMIFPKGTDWDGEKAKVVIGIAGKGDEHLTILGNIATKLSEEKSVEALLSMSVDEVYDFLTEGE